MQRALTILLPVRNVQSTLADTVVQVLETAADTSDRFAVLIIDDASTDATSEVGHDLCKQYPQVRMLRLKKPVGEEAAMRLGLAQIRGNVVCVRGGRSAALEPISAKTPLARPNYLDRSKTFAHEKW